MIMRRRVVVSTIVLAVIVSFVLSYVPAEACTNYLISKGASADGSTMITYAADAHDFFGELYYTPPGRHPEGAMRNVYDWDGGKFLGQIKQVPVTYSVVGLMNEHQVAIGETTFGGRSELVNPEGIIDYGSLMFIALERAKTAREAIKIMTGLVAEYGYASGGESFSIADPNEVWIMEMVGKGKGNKGAIWVARRVPDGYICAHANKARIRQFPMNDKKNCLYSEDIISYAREKGYFKGDNKEFSFMDTYAPVSFGSLRFCEARVWSMFRRAAPSLNLPDDYIKGNTGAEPLPLWIKPDEKLSVRDVMALMRDHFEGTDLDMTKDVGAGPYCLPYRWRPLRWKVDEKDDTRYFNERAVSTQQTAFSFVSQARSWLPNPIGGVFWFGLDDTYSTVYVPMYCGMRSIPRTHSGEVADLYNFSWDSAFWVFNFVSNYAYSRYSLMIPDIKTVQEELEGKFIADQPEVDKAALELYKKAPRLALDYLTKYSVKEGEDTVKRWRKLGEFLLVKYLDGNVKTPQEKVEHPGYPKAWYKRVVKDTGDRLKVPGKKKEEGH